MWSTFVLTGNLEPIYGIKQGNNQYISTPNNSASILKTQKDLASEMGVSVDTLQNYEKLKVLLAANFGRKKNSEAKKRKIAAEYVKLCGYKNGEMGRGRDKKVGPGGTPIQKMTLSEIAKHLNTSERNLKRLMRIDKNLTEDMKNLLDKGIISTKIAADTIASLSTEEQEQLISSLDVTKKPISGSVVMWADPLRRSV